MEEREIFVTRSSMPSFDEYIEAIKPLWDSHWLTNMGTFHRQLEAELRGYLDVPCLSLTVNGHMALELVIQALDLPEGSEVITTPFTFISTTHAIVRNRLVPIFCDVKCEDGNIDETKIEALITERTSAILPVHVYGNICAVEAIDEIAARFGLKVIYDAAHAFGVKVGGIGVGNFGDASIYSFHATKSYHTIEGGAAAFADPRLYDRLYNLKNFGIRGEELVVSVGSNAKMNEFAAIMGLCNLRRIDEALASRKAVAELYDERLSDVRGIRRFAPRQDATKNYAYYPIVVEDDYPLTRDELYAELKNTGIHCRKYFYPLTSDQACFRNKYRDVPLDTARDLSDRVLVIPMYEGMEHHDAERVMQCVARVD